MTERTRSEIPVAIVDVFGPPGMSGMRVGVCAPPSESFFDQFDRNWCEEVRQRLGLAVFLLQSDATRITESRGPRLAAPVRAFDICGEMTPVGASLIGSLVTETVLREIERRPHEPRVEQPDPPGDGLGRVAWVRLQGMSTCRVRRDILAPVGISLGLRRSDIDFGLPSVVGSQEASTLILAVQDRTTVQSLTGGTPEFAKVCGQIGLDACLIYAPTSSATRFVARLVMPGRGSSDLIASPVAAGALAKAMITNGLVDRNMTLGVEQYGPDGGCSVIEVVVEAQPRSRKIWAGGRTRFSGWRAIDVDATASLIDG